LILEQPIAPFQKTLHSNYTGKLTLFFLILLGSLALAELLSRRAIATLEKLYLITNDLPDKLTTEGEKIVWPESNIEDTHYLIKNFQNMSRSLAEQFVEIRQINTSLRQQMEELKESEERFAGMFRRHSAVMFLLEPETGAIVDANLAAETFYKYPRTSLLKMNISDINMFSEDDCKDILQEVRLGQKNFFVAEHKDAEGAIHTVEVHSTLIPVQDSAKLFSIINDISERKSIEKENARLEEKNRQLQKAESLGVMAGAIAHHFNNQLGVVIGNLEMALDDLQLGVTPPHGLNDAMLAAHKAAEVSGQMLTYLGQGTDRRKPLDLSTFCRQCLPLLQSAAPKNVHLALDLPAAAPIINASALQLQQLLTNLVTNAWEATSAAHGTIDIAVKTVSPKEISATHRFPIGRQAEDSAYGCLSVMDTGAGIASDDIDKLFDPFFSSKFTGRGLGLSIVLGVVKGHGGLITVESEKGRGSTFRVFFPISAEEIAPQPHKATPSATTDTGGTVLLVEDEEMMRNTAETMLKRLGFKILSAQDGVEALEVFHSHADEIDIVLSDLTMPRMNGWETMAALRHLQPDLPIILSSGHNESEAFDAKQHELPQAFLHKPYRLSDLRNALTAAMHKISISER
jgi:two-component system, cell cycle sensor histidine kinase and response regulator CckA